MSVYSFLNGHRDSEKWIVSKHPVVTPGQISGGLKVLSSGLRDAVHKEPRNSSEILNMNVI
jgi:hypothetical protein